MLQPKAVHVMLCMNLYQADLLELAVRLTQNSHKIEICCDSLNAVYYSYLSLRFF